MKQNLVVLLADIFNLFEIHPAPCVDYPESEIASGELKAPSRWRKTFAIVSSMLFMLQYSLKLSGLVLMLRDVVMGGNSGRRLA